MQVINNGQMDKGISSVTHWKQTKRMQLGAGINSSGTWLVKRRRGRCAAHTTLPWQS